VLFPRRGHFQLSKIKNLLRATTERKQRIRNRNSSGGQGRKANCRVTQGKRDVYVFIKKGETEPGWYDMVWDESPVRRWMIGLLRPKGIIAPVRYPLAFRFICAEVLIIEVTLTASGKVVASLFYSPLCQTEISVRGPTKYLWVLSDY